MPTWRTVASLTAIGVGTTALYFTCPAEETFSEFFEQFYDTKLWPIIKKKVDGNNNNDNNNKKSGNKLLKWIKSTTNKATNAIEKGVLFNVLFPENPRFEVYHLFRVAKLTMYIDQHPQGIELIFIGAGNSWFLNPLQNILLNIESELENRSQQ